MEIALIFREQRGQLADLAGFLPPLLCSLPPLGCIRTSATPQRWLERQKRMKQLGRELRRDPELSPSIPPSLTDSEGRELGALSR